MDYYGRIIHKKHSLFVRLNERGKILAESRIENTPEAVAKMLAPFEGKPR